MALSAAQVTKLDKIEKVLKQLEEIIVPPSATITGRVGLTVAGDFAQGFVARPGLIEAVKLIAEVKTEG